MKKKSTAAALILLILVVALFLFGIGNPTVRENNRKLKQAILAIDPEATSVTLDDIVPFAWDAVYTFDPYTSKEDMESVLTFSSSSIQETVSEGMVQLIFVRDRKVVASVCSYSDQLGYVVSFPTDKEGYGKIICGDHVVFEVTRDGESGIVRLLQTSDV